MIGARQQPLGGATHLGIGLHRPQLAHPRGEQGGQDAGARPYIGDHGMGAHAEFPDQKVQHGGRVSGSVFHIGLNPGRKSLSTVHLSLLLKLELNSSCLCQPYQ
ncbi:hypothetical protein D3C85_1470730 [compost metagenome]